MKAPAQGPIGIFDSGVGGLSVLRHLRADLPQEELLYVADQVHVPYGSRSLDEIKQLSEGVTRFLLGQGAKLIVVACNTASGAALTSLRRMFPEVPFVGMEPAVKPAAAQTANGKVGVLATNGTLESQRYVTLMSRFGGNVEIFENSCPGLVDQIEAGQTDSEATEMLLRSFLRPMLAEEVDTLVLGCTHYPFVIPLIERIVGDAMVIIDPAPAVSRQTRRVLEDAGLLTSSGKAGTVRLFTSGDAVRFAWLVELLLPAKLAVSRAVWRDGELYTA